jgi:hypothetical protein
MIIAIIGTTFWMAGDAVRGQAPPSQTAAPSRSFQPGPPLMPLEDSWIRWPLPASEKAYAVIDGRRLDGYVKEMAAISRRSRDRGEQWWGRIQGMPADKETELWLMDKFRKAGVPEVRAQSFDLPPQYYPK